MKVRDGRFNKMRTINRSKIILRIVIFHTKRDAFLIDSLATAGLQEGQPIYAVYR